MDKLEMIIRHAELTLYKLRCSLKRYVCVRKVHLGGSRSYTWLFLERISCSLLNFIKIIFLNADHAA